MIDIVAYKNELIFNARHKRNQSLRESDLYMIQDYPINDYQRSLIINYRKELRDYFQTSGVIEYVFTLENQELPLLATFPDLNKIPTLSSNIFVKYSSNINTSNLFGEYYSSNILTSNIIY